MIHVFFFAAAVTLCASSTAVNTFGKDTILAEFQHIFTYENSFAEISDDAFLQLVLEYRKNPPADTYWRNALSRFEMVRPHLNPRTNSHNNADKLLLFYDSVRQYIELSKIALKEDHSRVAILFDDAAFFWKVLREETLLKYTTPMDIRNYLHVLMDVLTFLKKTARKFVSIKSTEKPEWMAYYSNSELLRDLLVFHSDNGESDTKTIFSVPKWVVDELEQIFSDTRENSLSFHRREIKYNLFNQKLQQLANTPNISRLRYAPLIRAFIKSHLGPFQRYLPPFANGRTVNPPRAILNLTLTKSFLEHMQKLNDANPVILQASISAFRSLAAFYLHTKAFTKHFEPTLTEYAIKRFSKPSQKPIEVCSLSTFEAALRYNGIPSKALPPLFHARMFPTEDDRQRKEYSGLLRAYAYRAFYQARYHQSGYVDLWKQAISMLPLEFSQSLQDYIDLVESWLRAKTYPGVQVPFIIPKSIKSDLFQYSDILALEWILYNISDNSEWKDLQLDYIQRFEKHLQK